MGKAILFDSTLCVGCRECERACAQRWDLPYDDRGAVQEVLSERKLTTVRAFGERHSRKLCMHCVDPTCGSVCPVGALQKTRLGPVIYQESRCIGCRYCMFACPFSVPVYEWSRRQPRVKKCDMCHTRLQRGQPSVCSEACPTEATITGEMEDMIAEGRRRIKENPGQYFGRIYGLEEVGGTSVLMLGAVPMEQLGMPAGLARQALPVLTWRVLERVPDVASLGSVLLGGIWWITHRRQEVAAAEGSPGASRRKP